MSVHQPVRCNLILVTICDSDCHKFSDISILRDTVATLLKCGGICNGHFATNLLLSLSIKESLKPEKNERPAVLAKVESVQFLTPYTIIKRVIKQV